MRLTLIQQDRKHKADYALAKQRKRKSEEIHRAHVRVRTKILRREIAQERRKA